MANEGQLALLRQGRAVWNAWRKRNRDTKVDLSDTNLQGVDLEEVDFRRVDLSYTDLRGTDLMWANLREADLRGANLSQTSLRNAYLQEADLRGANFQEADLYQASFQGANLRRVKNLSPDRLREALNWNLAYYSSELCKDLGLPKDHNAIVDKKRALGGAYPRARIQDLWALLKEYV